jgi:hypothetical protein
MVPMRSLTICTPCHTLGTQVKDDEIGKACDMHGELKKCIHQFDRETKRKIGTLRIYLKRI